MGTKMLLSVVLVTLFSLAECSKSKYVVLAPSVVRPGRTLDLSIQLFNEGAHQVYAKMVNENSESREVEMITENTKIVEMQDTMGLEIPEDLISSQYRVFVEITAPEGQRYTMNTTVTTAFKTHSLFVITDKAMYKPGSLVRLRTMAVYSDLLPYTGLQDIIITDPNESRIKQWIGVSDNSGVLSRELQLSDQPVLGKWTIEVTTALKEKKRTEFTVMEYVLPKFDVKVNVPSYIWPEDDSMKIKVESKYTYGQPVKGQVDVMVNLKKYGSYEDQYDMPTIQKTIELEKGQASVTLNGEDLVSLAGSRKCYSSACYSDSMAIRSYALMENLLTGRTIEVTAVVKETLTGKNFSSEATVPVERYPYTVNFMDFSPTTFKAGLRWSGMVQLKKVDGSPPSEKDLLNYKLEEELLKVVMKCSVSGYLDDQKKEDFPISLSGFIEVEFSPHENATYCSIEVQFKFASTSRYLSKFLSRDENGMQVTLLYQNGPIQPERTAIFRVITTVSTRKIFIQLLSKSRIINSWTHFEEDSINEFDVEVYMDKDLCRRLAPSPSIFVYMITEDNELIADAIDFTVDGAFANKVSVDFSTDETEPGQDVSVTVDASPQSYVGLLAVDQSVLFLGSNDLTQSKVMSDLSQYDSGKAFSRPYYGYYYCWWPISRGGKDTHDVITNAGLQAMTDSLVYEYVYFTFDFDGPRAERGPPSAPSGPVGAAGPQGAPGSPGRISESVDLSPDISETKTLQEPERVRTEFPETWLWQDFVTGPDGKVTVQTQVPDTITSWVASAFALHQQDGLGVAPNTAKLTVAKPFFASLDLPYSMTRGEEVALKVTVFNYMAEDVNAVVTLKASDQFMVRHPNFLEARTGEDIMKHVFIESGDGVLVSFWIVPITLGDVPVSVETRSNMAADSLQREILVEPEGIPEEVGKPFFIALNEREQNQTEKISLAYPDSVVEGSQRALFTVYGDIMGPSLSGLDKLLRMPYGCGEQNMINFAPSIFILTYLEETKTVTPEIKAKAIGFMESGYQRELSYRRRDGSFSAFGERDDSGSTWLTAFVIRCFNQAKPFITIDQSIIDKAVEFITRNVGEDGELLEPGRVMNSRLQGGSSKGIGLTAYITAALLENKDDLSLNIYYTVERTIATSVRYLETQVEDIKDDPYLLSLVTYTLTMGRSSKAGLALEYLNGLAKTKGQDTYWKKDEEEEDHPDYWYRYYRPANAHTVEMNAYALLTYATQEMLLEGSRVVSWLAKQRNSLGGYRSTQDTVIALQAMATFQSLVGMNKDQNLDVSVQADDMEHHQFQTISSDNALLLQSYEVPSALSNVTIEATGLGLALVQMNIFYHKMDEESTEGLEIKVTSNTVNSEVETQVCVRWTLDEESGMVVIEMGQLTAYEPITENLLDQYGGMGLKRYEWSDRKLVLYLDEVTLNEMCLSVTSVNVSPVSNLQQANVNVFQYYNPDVHQTVAYLPAGLNNNDDFCKLCPDCCEESVTTAAPEGPCAGEPCRNGARCEEKESGTYVCRCRFGYTGNRCHLARAPKSLNLNDGNGASSVVYSPLLLVCLSVFLWAGRKL